jgi:acyl dehydratase
MTIQEGAVPMTAEWFFEDFEVDQLHTTMGRTVTETDLVNFVGLSGLFEELFINAEFAREGSLFKGRAVPGLLILVFAEGLYVQTGRSHKGRAYLGLDELRLVAPVLVGDTLWVDATVEEVRRSESRPGYGVLVLRHRVRNQRDEEVMSYKTARLLEARPAEGS